MLSPLLSTSDAGLKLGEEPGIFDYRTEKVNLAIAKNSYMGFIQQLGYF
jgi:hypothetical protein